MNDPASNPADNGSGGTEASSTWFRSLFSGRRRRWVVGIVLINLLAVLVLAGIGSAHVTECGGFSGYSGGGGNNCHADVSVGQYAAPSPAKVGQKLIYLITIRDRGPDRSGSIELTVRLPKGVQVNWYMASQTDYSYCQYQNLVVQCYYYGGVNKGGSVAATVVVVPLQKGTLRTVATAHGSSKDPNKKNNTSTLLVTVKG